MTMDEFRQQWDAEVPAREQTGRYGHHGYKPALQSGREAYREELGYQHAREFRHLSFGRRTWGEFVDYCLSGSGIPKKGTRAARIEQAFIRFGLTFNTEFVRDTRCPRVATEEPASHGPGQRGF